MGPDRGSRSAGRDGTRRVKEFACLHVRRSGLLLLLGASMVAGGMLLTRAPSRPPVVHATTESRVDPAPVPGEIRALALRLPADNPQRAFLADGMVTVEEREAAATAARDCSLAAARQLGLRASASRADQDGVAGYEFAISGDEARTTLWEARSDRCGDANEALVEAALSGGSAYDDAGVNQLEVDLVRNRVLAAA